VAATVVQGFAPVQSPHPTTPHQPPEQSLRPGRWYEHHREDQQQSPDLMPEAHWGDLHTMPHGRRTRSATPTPATRRPTPHPRWPP
jgi:hypothetical protein